MTTIKIKGMSCGHCVGAVTKALEGIAGITNVTVNLEKGEADYEQASPVEMARIKQAISGIGFEVM